MKTKNALEFPATLDGLYRHPDFQPFGSSSDDWLHDPERMERCNDAAGHGADGSTHAEILQDWREFLSRLEDEATRAARWHERICAEIERRAESIRAEIDACEAWHRENGSIDEEIG